MGNFSNVGFTPSFPGAANAGNVNTPSSIPDQGTVRSYDAKNGVISESAKQNRVPNYNKAPFPLPLKP
jgi:hypothetical protein